MPRSMNASYSSSRNGRMSGTRAHRRSLDELCEPSHRLRLRVRQHSVTEIENVPRPAGRAREHIERGGLGPLPWAEQQRGIEVALHAAIVAGQRPAVIERNAPVEADHV